MMKEERFVYESVSVSSGVKDQPQTDKETFQGAINRANNAFFAKKGADYYVGIEGGIELVDNEMEAFAWVAVRSEDRIGKSRTGSFFLPREVAELVKQGKELGEADDIVFKRKNSKQQNGAVGILTDDAIDRTKYYTEAVILALIPFKNTDLY